MLLCGPGSVIHLGSHLKYVTPFVKDAPQGTELPGMVASSGCDIRTAMVGLGLVNLRDSST